MNFEFNKVAGAILGTGLGVMAVGIIAEIIYAAPHDEKPGYIIAVAGSGGEGGGGNAPAEVTPIAVRLQTANVDAGKNTTKICQACHTFDKGGPTKVGPNLWDVVGAPIIHEASFPYSDAFKQKGQAGFTWTFEELDHFLTNPRGYIPGTLMTYAGLKDPQKRADVIAYLRTLSDNPVPLPAATAAATPPPAPGGAPASGGDNAAPAPAPGATPPAGESPGGASPN
jgi:cytochrome c